MFEGDLRDLSKAELLSSAGEHHAQQRRMEIRLLEHALQWADLNHPDGDGHRGASGPGGERDVTPGGGRDASAGGGSAGPVMGGAGRVEVWSWDSVVRWRSSTVGTGAGIRRR